MIQRVIVVLFFLTMIFCAGASFFISTASNTAVNRHYDYLERPQSATDLIMASRQVAPDEPGGPPAWLGAGLLAITLIIGVGVVFLMRGGADLVRQMRLARKQAQRAALAPLSWQPFQEMQELPPMHRLPAMPQTPQLPANGDSHETAGY